MEGMPDSRCLSQENEKMFSINVLRYSTVHLCSYHLGPIWELTTSLVSPFLQRSCVYCSLTVTPIRVGADKIRGSGNLGMLLVSNRVGKSYFEVEGRRLNVVPRLSLDFILLSFLPANLDHEKTEQAISNSFLFQVGNQISRCVHNNYQQ